MKVALVTGAYKGLGLAWSKKLIQEGYEVILTARNLEQAENGKMNFSEQDKLRVYPKALDVSDENQLATLAVWIETKFSQLDLVINNAGINPKDYSDKSKMAKAFYLKNLDAEELFQVFKINSVAPLLVVKHLRSLLIKSENPKVISISSWLGSVTNLSFGGHYGYVGSKNL